MECLAHKMTLIKLHGGIISLNIVRIYVRKGKQYLVLEILSISCTQVKIKSITKLLVYKKVNKEPLEKQHIQIINIDYWIYVFKKFAFKL